MKATFGLVLALLLCSASTTALFAGVAAPSACDCLIPPPADQADFQVGAPVFIAPDSFAVPLIVNTREDATFTQMTLNFDPGCVTYESVELGSSVANAGVVFALEDPPGTVIVNVTGEYSGCDQEVFVLKFRLTGVAPCDLVWEQALGGPNSKCHLNYDKTSGGDGKILPNDIVFCDGRICDIDVAVSGTVEYYSNNTPIINNVPDNPASAAVTVEDCPQVQTDMTSSPNGDYMLNYGPGPVMLDLCASRPMAACGGDEDGVISGDDIIMLQDTLAVSPLGFADPKQQLASDVNKDNLVTLADVLMVKRWIGRKVCDGTDSCGGFNDNCAATWRFIFLTNPPAFETDMAALGEVCIDQTVDIEGILLGDVDGSWPDFFLPKVEMAVSLALDVRSESNDEVVVALRVELDEGESLRHVVYSLDFDAGAFEYLGNEVAGAAARWGSFDNPDSPGEAHGIVHRPALSSELSQSGEFLVFRFRALVENASSQVRFTRLKANNLDVNLPEIVIHADGSSNTVATPPTRYSVSSRPNPFNPRTNIEYTIPDGVTRVPVSLHIYDIAGHRVRTLETAQRGAGRYVVTWDGTDDTGQAMGTGIYMLQIRAGEWKSNEKLTLLK